MISQNNIRIYKDNDFNYMSKSGKLASDTLNFIEKYIEVGVNTNHLNNLCHNFIINNGGIPAPLNYKGFPKSVCTSINNIVCHGVPTSLFLSEGDIINIDIAVNLNGWYGDTSKMFFVGNRANNIKSKLISYICYKSVLKAMSIIKPNIKFNEIGKAIESYIKPFGYSIVRDYCGHGIGKQLHSSPNILHYKDESYNNLVMKEGMFFTIEPMINEGSSYIKILNDDYSVVTKDYQLSAQFEHTIGITYSGYINFTKSIKNSYFSI